MCARPWSRKPSAAKRTRSGCRRSRARATSVSIPRVSMTPLPNRSRTAPSNPSAAERFEEALARWSRFLLVQEAKSDGTVRQYERAVRRCHEWVVAQHGPDGLMAVTPGQLHTWYEQWVGRFEAGVCQADAVRGAVFAVRSFTRWGATQARPALYSTDPA